MARADGTTPSDTITLSATDSLGDSGTGSVGVTIRPFPTIGAPAKATVGVAQATAIGGLSLSDSGTMPGETYTVTLSDTSGVLAATGTGVSRSGTKTLPLTGTLAQANAALATVTDTDGTTPSDTITIGATDSLGDSSAAKSVAVTVNSKPVLTTPTSATVGVGQARTITGLSLSETGNTLL